MTTRALKPEALDGSFLIVGIGVSAGGLQAIEAFLASPASAARQKPVVNQEQQ